jgi:hypothetical protein
MSATISLSSALTGPVSFDLSLPTPANPYWAGATQLYVDCHSHSVYNQYLGQKELTGLATGQFLTMSFDVPSAVQSALSHGCADLSFTIAINVPTNSTGSYLLDNLQLAGPPIVTACNEVPSSSGDGGVSATTVNFSNQLVRPDIGTFTLDTTAVQGSPITLTRTFKLNGNPLYSIQTQVSSNSSFTRNEAYFPPITGVKNVTGISDGKTIIFTVDGRQTLSSAVGADPTTVQFADGKPAPQLNIDSSIRDAMIQLLNSAQTQSKACLSPQANQVLLAAAETSAPGHPSGDSGSACTGGEVDCDLGEVACVGLALAGCGPFAFLCGSGCVGGYEGCLSFVHRSGTDCCPVACGGESGITNPIGACCLGGEICLKRSTDGHVALCCDSGTTACGGTQCCGPNDTCFTSQGTNGATTGLCCPPEQIRNGQCCILGTCTTRADCNAGDPNGNNGCGANGCCVIG